MGMPLSSFVEKITKSTGFWSKWPSPHSSTHRKGPRPERPDSSGSQVAGMRPETEKESDSCSFYKGLDLGCFYEKVQTPKRNKTQP